MHDCRCNRFSRLQEKISPWGPAKAGPDSMQYETDTVEETFGSLTLRLEKIASLDRAIDGMFEELSARGSAQMLDELCPYFGNVWPAARMLARWVAKNSQAFSGTRVLEVGCGLALPSFVASTFGAEVCASDGHPDVPAFLKRNLALNPTCQVTYQHIDWRNPSACSSPFDWVVASDVLYEKYQAASLVSFLSTYLSPKGRAVIADPDRSYWNRFVVLARHAGFRVHHEPLAAERSGDPKNAVLIHVERLAHGE